MNKPILLLLFNRPDTTEKVFEAIARVKPAHLFVAADGPRPEKEGELEKCLAARDVVNRVDWDCDVKTLFRDENLGCKQAVSSAIDWFFEQVEEGIILEDDCLPSESFFSFCDELLDRYRDDSRVMMISGNNFQDGFRRGHDSYYFSRIFHIWGWATWRRAWNLYDKEMRGFSESDGLQIEALFQDRNIALWWMYLFLQVHCGVLNSWAYPWVYSCLVNNGLSIVPQKNLVTNIGFGLEGTHTKQSCSDAAGRARFDLEVAFHPRYVFGDDVADAYEYRKEKIFPLKECHTLRDCVRRLRRSRQLRRRIARLLSTGCS